MIMINIDAHISYKQQPIITKNMNVRIYALKGQPNSAQGIALGIRTIPNTAPCKGNINYMHIYKHIHLKYFIFVNKSS